MMLNIYFYNFISNFAIIFYRPEGLAEFYQYPDYKGGDKEEREQPHESSIFTMANNYCPGDKVMKGPTLFGCECSKTICHKPYSHDDKEEMHR